LQSTDSYPLLQQSSQNFPLALTFLNASLTRLKGHESSLLNMKARPNDAYWLVSWILQPPAHSSAIKASASRLPQNESIWMVLACRAWTASRGLLKFVTDLALKRDSTKLSPQAKPEIAPTSTSFKSLVYSVEDNPTKTCANGRMYGSENDNTCSRALVMPAAAAAVKW